MATVLNTNDPVPAALQTLEFEGWTVEVAKSTYPANNPSEDRSTVAIDPDSNYIFCGVWDGHGTGTQFVSPSQFLPIPPARPPPI